MTSGFEAAIDIIRAKRMGLRQSDIREIKALLNKLDPERGHELKAWIYEGLFLIVNDPAYEGDILPLG